MKNKKVKNELRKIVSTQDIDLLQIQEYNKEAIESIDVEEDVRNYLINKFNTEGSAIFTNIDPGDAYYATLEKLLEPLAFINSYHETVGNFSYDFDGLKEEYEFLEADHDFDGHFYNSSDEPFDTIEEAFEDEAVFAKQVVTDFLKSKVYPLMTKKQVSKTRRMLKEILSQIQNVEMRIYNVNGKDKLYFVHNVDWDVLVDYLEEIMG